jgi:hypothetical protein
VRHEDQVSLLLAQQPQRGGELVAGADPDPDPPRAASIRCAARPRLKMLASALAL